MPVAKVPGAMSAVGELDWLRTALLASPAPAAMPESGAEGGLDDAAIAGEEEGARAPVAAAVLFPIVLRPAAPTVLLTRRTDHLKDHPGQISFPGGRVEPDDVSPAHTALREAEEEIGLAPAQVEVAGYLPEYLTSTGFRVTPVVAVVTPPFSLRLDPFEVAEAFEVPLDFLLDPANHRRHALHYRGRLRHFHAMPWGEYFIWGATAGMIVSLSRALGTRR